MIDEAAAKAMSDNEVLRHLLDTLPIYAARIGIRSDSTEEDAAFMHFLFKIHDEWLQWSEQREEEAS